MQINQAMNDGRTPLYIAAREEGQLLESGAIFKMDVNAAEEDSTYEQKDCHRRSFIRCTRLD